MYEKVQSRGSLTPFFRPAPRLPGPTGLRLPIPGPAGRTARAAAVTDGLMGASPLHPESP